jgi:Uma2 family endonuclease
MTSVAHTDHFTVADLEDTPDDGRRYEVINGTLVVTPAPFMPHNERGTRIALALAAAAPGAFEVCVTGTAGVEVGDDLLIPDVVVYRSGDYQRNLPVDAVVLVVEVTSPSNRSNDTVLKLDRYARAGIPHYWIIDPDAVSVYELVDGRYRLQRYGEDVAVAEPFEVRVRLVGQAD